MGRAGLNAFAAALLVCEISSLPAQNTPPPEPEHLTLSGTILTSGHSVAYVIHQLPVSSFPALPDAVQDALNRRGCLIPQTYEAHRPENVVQASLEHPGSSDWAVLCSAHGTVSLLVFFSSAPEHPMVLATPETERLQAHDPSGVLGFNWGIDPASPDPVHEAQIGLARRPPSSTTMPSPTRSLTIAPFSLLFQRHWTLIDMPE